MRRTIEKGATISLISNGQNVEFNIDDIIGIGGSCIAYRVTYFENEVIPHKGVLKEYCPAFLDEKEGFDREENTLIIPSEVEDVFLKGIQVFKKTYKNINDYINTNVSALNYHPIQIGLFEGNNTIYTLCSADFGKTYDNIPDTNIESLIRLMISISIAVKQYHDAGFLHLDIKPKNILVLDNVTDIVKLFDYDSLTLIESLKTNSTIAIPVPEDCYVPELVNLNRRYIGVQTDVFEIGAMFYKRLFGKAHSSNDLDYDTVYDFESSKLLENVSPAALYEINLLLKRTLQVSPRRRYKNIDELLSQLKKILGMVSSKNPYLMNLPVWHPSKHCIERDVEIKEINQRLERDGYVFIKGMGGLGKSELTKIYVNRFGFKYHTIQFCKYVDSLKSLVASLSIEGFNEFDYKDLDSLIKAKNRILHNCNEQTLLIVDNYNVPHDNFLRDFLPVNSNSFKVIFTTRCDPAADYYEDKIMNLHPLEEDDAVKLFYMHSKISENNDRKVKDLLNEIQYNTLLLVLIAKVIGITGMSIAEMIEKLQQQQLDNIKTRVFYEYDSDGDAESYNLINQHLSAVFNISGLNYEEILTLVNMTLISPYGIEVKDFVENTGNYSNTYNCIYNLIILGWIELRGNLISLHSIISDVIASKIQDRTDSYYELSEYLESLCYVDEDQHITIIHKALATALQLNRRYINEDESMIASISFILGMIYSYLYKPKESKKLLKKAIEIEERIGDNEALTIIYSQIGPFEEKFGTKTEAINWYRKTIETAEKTTCDFREEICNSLLGIAECYDEDNQKAEALLKFIEVFHYMEKNNFIEYIRGVLEKIIELLTELNRESEINYYETKLNQYGGKREEDDEIPIDDMLESGDFEGAKYEYEKFLNDIREDIGEESPAYKDYAKYRWVYYLLTNDKTQAMRIIAENLTFIEETYGKDSMEMADFLTAVSYQMTDNCEFDYAIETAERALEICVLNRQKFSYIYAKANMDLIAAYVVLGEYQKAKKYIKDIDFSRFSGDEYNADTVRSVGMALLELGEYETCVDICKKALSRTGVDRLSKMIAAELLVIYYDKIGRIDLAEEYLSLIAEKVNSLSTKRHAIYHIITYHRLSARLLAKKNDFSGAIEELNEAINMAEDDLDMILLQCYIERGLCFVYQKQINDAEDDYNRCENIIERYGLSENYYIIIYNNVALAKMQSDDFLSAKEYFERIITKIPNILNPQNHNEVTICQNYGWVLYNLDDSQKGKEFIENAIGYYENHGFEAAIDYYSALYNLLVVNNSLNMFEDNLIVAQKLYDNYKAIESARDCTSVFRISIVCALISGLLATERAKEAYDFANAEERYFVKKYGKKSVERIDYLQTCAYAFYRLMYTDVFEFLNRAEKIIQKAKLQKSMWEARQLNYVGIAYLDLTDYIERGNKYINEAKTLFEEIGAQDDYMYSIVVKNAEYAHEKMMDKLISDMAKAMIEETEDYNE